MQTYIPQSKTFLKQTNKTDKQIASLTFEFYMISLFFLHNMICFSKTKAKKLRSHKVLFLYKQNSKLWDVSLGKMDV